MSALLTPRGYDCDADVNGDQVIETVQTLPCRTDWQSLVSNATTGVIYTADRLLVVRGRNRICRKDEGGRESFSGKLLAAQLDTHP